MITQWSDFIKLLIYAYLVKRKKISNAKSHMKSNALLDLVKFIVSYYSKSLFKAKRSIIFT